jgi:hypothetical protein
MESVERKRWWCEWRVWRGRGGGVDGECGEEEVVV